MKKVITIIALAAFVAGMSSCRKDRTCTCTTDGEKDVEILKGFTAKEAKNYCLEQVIDEEYMDSEYYEETTCELD